LKFLFVTPALGIGGVERWFLTLARHIRQVRPHAIVLTGDKSIHPQILAEAESICPVIRAGENPLEARPLLWEASKACDAVLTWGFQPNLAYLVKHLDLPTVLVSHGSEELNQLLLANAPYATHYAAVSQVAADAFPHPYREQVTVIPNGSDVERSAPNPGARQRLRGEWGVGDRTVILYLGRLSPEKRPDLVLMAAKELGESYAVVLCGPPVQKSWDRIQEINGNIPNLVLHIDKELEPRDVLAASDVLALPSLYEGFPLAAVEAWFAKKPVACTPFEAAKEICNRDGDVLFLSDNMHTPRTFAAAIRKAAMDDGTVVERAWSVAWENYTATAMARRWDEYLMRVVAEHRKSRMQGAKGMKLAKPVKEKVA
jgi:glycosyltransferase involved in cell wall biosynthesis